ncbi:MAG: FeoB-associated Cys-rich membrane protein [Candidatus Symbiothrix sp.]|nr:FeoB-associated Cys-rich membrane protein [Candidatus Symbiothrix sp.]
MWQEIAIYIIGILVGVYLFWQIYRFFCNKKTRTDHCADCPGCVLYPKNKD